MNIALARVMGYQGLALGTSIAALLNAAMLLFLLRRRLEGIEDRRVLQSLAKIAVASAIMGLAAWAAHALLGRAMPGAGLAAGVVRLAAAIGAALAVLGAAAHVLHIDEFRRGVRVVQSKLGRRRS